MTTWWPTTAANDDGQKRIRGRQLQAIRDRHFSKHPLCVHCLAKTPPVVTVATELDHIVPLFKNGKDVESNRQGLCSACHEVKTRQDLGWSEKRAIGADGWPV